nr:hypothetical protein [uncultured Acetatifactor sp.]
MKLVIEVKRRRMSVTQGQADVYVNGQKVITFGDKIEMIKEGDRCYGKNIGGWGSKKPDSVFIAGYLWHPHDELYSYREKMERILVDDEETGESAENRLAVLLANAVGLYAEQHSDNYNTSEEFWEMFLGEMGTDFEELEALGVNIEDMKEAVR